MKAPVCGTVVMQNVKVGEDYFLISRKKDVTGAFIFLADSSLVTVEAVTK